MMANQGLIGKTEAILISCAILLIFFGLGYAVTSGLLQLPARQWLNADRLDERPSTSIATSGLTDEPDTALPTSPAAESVAQPALADTENETAVSARQSSTSPSPTLGGATLTDPAVIRDNQRKADLAAIQVALQAYRQSTKGYPVSPDFASGKSFDPTSPLNILVPKYLESLPIDPLMVIDSGRTDRWYGYQSDGQTAALTALLENFTDPQGAFVGNNYIYTVKLP